MESAAAIVQNEMWDKALDSALTQTASVVEHSRGADLAVLFAGSSYAVCFRTWCGACRKPPAAAY